MNRALERTTECEFLTHMGFCSGWPAARCLRALAVFALCGSSLSPCMRTAKFSVHFKPAKGCISAPLCVRSTLRTSQCVSVCVCGRRRYLEADSINESSSPAAARAASLLHPSSPTRLSITLNGHLLFIESLFSASVIFCRLKN